MSKLRDYCRLAANYYEDDVLLAAADECPAAMHVWPILVAKAKQASHVVDNPDGVIRTTLARLARDAYVDVSVVGLALDSLADGELASVHVEGTNRVRIMLSGFCKWQNASQSSADYKERQRANASREKAVISPVGVQRPSSNHPLEREEEREGVSVVTSVTTSSAGKPARPQTPKDPNHVASKPAVDGCFEFYCDLWEKRGQYALDLTAARRSRIAAAIRKHGKRVVVDALRYHHANDWRHESLDRNDIAVLLREKNIQSAIEGLRGNPQSVKRSVGSRLDTQWNGR